MRVEEGSIVMINVENFFKIFVLVMNNLLYWFVSCFIEM